MSSQTGLARSSILLTPFAEEVLLGFEKNVEKHQPDNTLMYFICDKCEALHVEVVEDPSAPSITLPPGLWQLRH
jgi:hypothetical protein